MHWGAFATIVCLSVVIVALLIAMLAQRRRHSANARAVEVLNVRIDAANAHRRLMEITRDAYVQMTEAAISYHRPEQLDADEVG